MGYPAPPSVCPSICGSVPSYWRKIPSPLPTYTWVGALMGFARSALRPLGPQTSESKRTVQPEHWPKNTLWPVLTILPSGHLEIPPEQEFHCCPLGFPRV